MADLENLMSLVVEFRDDRNWKQFHSPKDLALAIGIEAAELQELFLWKSNDEIDSKRNELRKNVEHELSDIFAYVLAFADEYQIDLAKALQEKMKINEDKYPAERVFGSAKKYNEY